MEETFKMMERIITGKESKVDEKQLIKEYQEKLSPNILAYFYVNNFGIIYKTSELYKIINNEDKASFCLQELDNCLQNFDLHKNNKFITYFIKCFKNRLRTETELLNMQKRKIMIDYDELTDISSEDNLENFDDILNQYYLTNNDKKLCRLLDAGYKIKEIAKIFNLQPITIYKRKENLKQKILNSDINFA